MQNSTGHLSKQNQLYKSVDRSINYNHYGRLLVAEIFDAQLLLLRSEIDSSFNGKG